LTRSVNFLASKSTSSLKHSIELHLLWTWCEAYSRNTFLKFNDLENRFLNKTVHPHELLHILSLTFQLLILVIFIP